MSTPMPTGDRLPRFTRDRGEKSLNVRISEELHHRLDVYCAIHNKTMKVFVIEALTEKLEAEARNAATFDDILT
jgi:hypothetical protein